MVPATFLPYQCEARSSAPTPAALVPGSDASQLLPRPLSLLCSLQWCWACASCPCLPCLDPKSASVSHHSLSLSHLMLLSLHACSWSPAQVLMWKWEGTWPFTVWPLKASTRTLLPSVFRHPCGCGACTGKGKGLPDPTLPLLPPVPTLVTAAPERGRQFLQLF